MAKLYIKRFLQQEKSDEPKAGKTQGANAHGSYYDMDRPLAWKVRSQNSGYTTAMWDCNIRINFILQHIALQYLISWKTMYMMIVARSRQ